MVQESVSSSCFQVKSSTTEAPKLSSSVSVRFGIAFMAPLGRSRSLRYMLIGDVKMWRSIVDGRMTMKAMKLPMWRTHDTWCAPDSHDTFSTVLASG